MRVIIAWLVLLLGCLSARAATLSATPDTFAGQLAAMGPGDTLELQAGTYPGLDCRVGGLRCPHGTSWQDVPVIRAAPGAQVVLPFLAFTGEAMRYLQVQGVVVDGGWQSRETVYVSDGAGYIRVQDTEIRQASAHGVLLPSEGVGHNEFVRTDVSRNGTRQHFDHGLYIASPDNLIRDSRIHHNAAYGIHIYASGNAVAHRNRIENNQIYSNGTLGPTAIGLLLSDGEGQIAVGNHLWDNLSGDLVVSERAPGAYVRDNETSGRVEIRAPLADGPVPALASSAPGRRPGPTGLRVLVVGP